MTVTSVSLDQYISQLETTENKQKRFSVLDQSLKFEKMNPSTREDAGRRWKLIKILLVVCSNSAKHVREKREFPITYF